MPKCKRNGKGKRRHGSLLLKLVRNNTGISSKNFFLVVTVMVSVFMLLTLSFVLIIDVAKDGEVTMDMTGMAEVIAAIVGLLTSAGVCKVMGERNECGREPYVVVDEEENCENDE